MTLDRPFYDDINYHPYLFYIIFGAVQQRLEVSKERHHVDSFPEGLEFFFIDRENDSKYMDNILGGTVGSILMDEDPELYQRAKEESSWAIIRGEVKEDSDLSYMRNVVGFVQALLEKGAKGVIDLITVKIHSPHDWRRIFQEEFNPCEHVLVLSSEDRRAKKAVMWVHTRGMSKFGRPDVSFGNVPVGKEHAAAAVINQMIYFGAQGAFYTKPAKFHFNKKHACVVTPVFQNDFDNNVFNNAFYKIDWDECQFD